MPKHKKRGPAKPQGMNLSQQRKVRDDVIKKMQMETTRRYLIDLVTITLNDPKYMGGDAFGYSRIRRVLDGLQENYDAFFDSQTTSPEADYYQEKMDKAILRVVQDRDDFEPFKQRYPYLPEIRYTK